MVTKATKNEAPFGAAQGEPSALLENRIVELSFIPINELPPHLSKLGLQSQLVDDGHTIVINNGQMVVSFRESDPVSTAVQLGFAFCNHLWPSALPNLLPKVTQEWKRRRK